MKRFFLYPLAAVAAIVPAGTGLMANGSFSHDIRVRTPERAQVLRLASPTPTGTATPTRSAEPGDDHGGDRIRVRVTRSAEPGDDHGGHHRHGSDDGSGHGSGHGGDGSGGHGSDD